MATTGVRVATAERQAETLDLSELDRQWAEKQSRTKPHVAGYTTLAPLGEGAFGEVWSAEDTGTKLLVAIKFFRHSSGWQRLHEEIKQLGTLQGDPNIIAVLDVAEPDEKGRPYYVMRRAESSLADQIKAGPLPLAQALTWFKQIVRAMVFVHAKGIRHCDLKPGNILIEADGRALVADFGQAHLSHDATPALGTLFYMAPEQATLTEQVPDTAWDVYGLGALLYAMLIGHPPRAPEHVRDEIDSTPETGKKLARYRQWLKESPVPDAHRKVAGMDSELSAVIDRCLAVEPAKRYWDARAIQYALDRRERRLRQRPWLIFALIAPLVMLMTIGLTTFFSGRQAEESQQRLLEQLPKIDMVAVRLVAKAVDEHLQTRKQVIENALAQRANAHAPTVESLLATAIQNRDTAELETYVQKLHREHERSFFRWSVLDAEGFLQAAAGQSGESDEQSRVKEQELKDHKLSLSFRSWFHGDIDRYDNPNDHYPPIKQSHISHPYFGKATNTGVICFSAPIRHPDDPAVVGVIAAQVTVKDLADWVQQIEIPDGCVVLVNDQGYSVLHRDPSDSSQLLEPKPNELPPRLGPEVKNLIDQAKQGSEPSPELVPSGYRDAIDRKEYLAAMKILPQSKWAVIVQHELQAISQSRSIGGWVLGTSIALVLGMWGCLYFNLQREQDGAHA